MTLSDFQPGSGAGFSCLGGARLSAGSKPLPYARTRVLGPCVCAELESLNKRLFVNYVLTDLMFQLRCQEQR